MKYVYYYDNDGLFTVKEQAYLDELESAKQGKDVYFCPEMATLDELPELSENQCAHIKADNTWEVLPDYRHKFVCDEKLNISEVTYIGEIKDGYVLLTDEQIETIRNDSIYYIVKDGELIENPNYEEEKAAKNKEYFSKNFFNTSLGYVRREVTMADGNTKNFLSDLYPTILTMVNNGISVPILVYNEPDYSKELTTEYMETLQQKVIATAEFVTECGNQLLADFQG